MKTHPAWKAECPHPRKIAPSNLRISRNYRKFATSYRDELQRKQPHQTTGFVLRSESRFRFGRGRASAPPLGAGAQALCAFGTPPRGLAGARAHFLEPALPECSERWTRVSTRHHAPCPRSPRGRDCGHGARHRVKLEAGA